MKGILLLLGLLIAAPALAISGKATFEANTFGGFITFGGSCPISGGEIKDGMLSGKLICDLTKISTGDSDRDAHLHEAFLHTRKASKEVLKEFPEVKDAKLYPKAEFEFLKPIKAVGKRYFKGKLTLHGVSKEIGGDIEFIGQNAKTEFKLDMTEYQIEQPKLDMLGITVDKRVNISVELER